MMIPPEIRGLAWQPLGHAIASSAAPEDYILLLVVPFIQRGALCGLLDACGTTDALKIVTRWRGEDILSGVSDISVYDELQMRHIPLYVNDAIHLKLLVYASNSCFVTSANVTNVGLGYASKPNTEVGCWASLSRQDWAKVYEIVEASILVDGDLYQQARDFVVEHRTPQEPVPQRPPFEDRRKDFSLSALPACVHPNALRNFYLSGDGAGLGVEHVRRAVHDLVLFGIGDNVPASEFLDCVGRGFRSQPFVKALVAHISARGQLRFGEVNEWIHQHCADVPLPYCWQVKDNTHILYDWLAFYYTEIEWRVPGQHSQVIYWRGENA